MVSVTLELELPDWAAVTALMSAFESAFDRLADGREDWKLVRYDYHSATCPRCGGEMSYSPDLQANVCPHPE